MQDNGYTIPIHINVLHLLRGGYNGYVHFKRAGTGAWVLHKDGLDIPQPLPVIKTLNHYGSPDVSIA